MERMKQAQALAADGSPDKALTEYLALFDQDGIEPEFVGVRGSFLLMYIANLGAAYPPALDALKQRRDSAQAKVDAAGLAQADLRVLMDLASLNYALAEQPRNLKLYHDLRAAAPNSFGLDYVAALAGEELVKERRDLERQREKNGIPADDALAAAKPSKAVLVAPMPAVTHALDNQRPYHFDPAAFDADLKRAQSPEIQNRIIANRWSALRLAVGHVDVVAQTGFHHSMGLWQFGLAEKAWVTNSEGDLAQAAAVTGNAQVQGSCAGTITLDRGGLVHIWGDLSGTLKAAEQSEIVIGGNIAATGRIEAEGIVHVFVGGSVAGTIESTGSATLWVNGDYTGKLAAGTPLTDVHVMGDFDGKIIPLGGGMLHLEVSGFMPAAPLAASADAGFTQFKASVGTSDVAAGIYASDNRHGVWVVHAQAGN
jgi:cytoskeletal protein CcmA (bactofilin family)